MSKKLTFFLEVVLLFVIPIIFLTTNSSLMAVRPFVIGAGGLYVTWRLIIGKVNSAKLGLRATNLLASLRALGFPSLLIVVLTYLTFLLLPMSFLKTIVGYEPVTGFTLTSRLLFYNFLSVPIQELIFRGYVTWRLRDTFKSRVLISAISIFLFTFAHLPFYSLIMLIITFFMAKLYIKNYLAYGNLYGPIISHAVIGSLVILIRNAYFPF